MESYFTFLLVVATIINVVILIKFFKISSDVSKIQNKIPGEPTVEEYLAKAKEEKYVGNIKGYKDYLLRAKYLYKIKVDSIEDDSYAKNKIEYFEGKMSEIDELLKDE